MNRWRQQGRIIAMWPWPDKTKIYVKVYLEINICNLLCTCQLKPLHPLVRGNTSDSGEMCSVVYFPMALRSAEWMHGFVMAPKITGIWVYTEVWGHLAGNLPAACEEFDMQRDL